MIRLSVVSEVAKTSSGTAGTDSGTDSDRARTSSGTAGINSDAAGTDCAKVRYVNKVHTMNFTHHHFSGTTSLIPPSGPAKQMNLEALEILSATIHERRTSTAEKSYTRQLLDAGPPKCAKKLGEEAVELVIAATSEDDKALHNEAADVLYHMLVLLESRGTNLAPVLEILAERHGISGLDEKASRQNP